MTDIATLEREWYTVRDTARQALAALTDDKPEEWRTKQRAEIDRKLRWEAERVGAMVAAVTAQLREQARRKALRGQTRSPQAEALLLQKAEALAAPLSGQPTQMVRSRLIEPARELAGAGLLDEAAVLVAAAARLGVEDGDLTQAMQEQNPALIEARHMAEAADEHDRRIAAQVSYDVATLVGKPEERAAAGISLKNAKAEGHTFESLAEPLPDPDLERMQGRVEMAQAEHGQRTLRGDGQNFSPENDNLPGKRPRD